jgi:broad specificity phosphatase PhoE
MLRAMPTILLVRHGQASFGTADYDQLSPIGVGQASTVAEHLVERGLKVERIVSGGLRRQRDTAAPAATRFGQSVEIDPRWDEYAMDEIIAAHSPTPASASPSEPGEEVSARHYQLVLEQALAAWIAAGRDESACESWPAFQARIRAALDEVAASLGNGTTGLVFTSGGVIAALGLTLLGLPAPAMLTLNRVAVNTGITKLICGRRGITLVSFNEHAHLELAETAITYR